MIQLELLQPNRIHRPEWTANVTAAIDRLRDGESRRDLHASGQFSACVLDEAERYLEEIREKAMRREGGRALELREQRSGISSASGS